MTSQQYNVHVSIFCFILDIKVIYISFFYYMWCHPDLLSSSANSTGLTNIPLRRLIFTLFGIENESMCVVNSTGCTLGSTLVSVRLATCESEVNIYEVVEKISKHMHEDVHKLMVGEYHRPSVWILYLLELTVLKEKSRRVSVIKEKSYYGAGADQMFWGLVNANPPCFGFLIECIYI